MPWGLSRSAPALHHGDLNAVLWKMERAKEKRPTAISSVLRNALTGVQAIKAPTTVEQFREFNSRTTALLAGQLCKSKQRELLSTITKLAYATMPEKERVKEALIEARDSGKDLVRELSAQGQVGQAHLQDIVSTLITSSGTLEASPSVMAVLKKMADADERRTDLIQRDLFTVQEADQYPSVWASLVQDYCASLQRELDEITAVTPRLQQGISDASEACDAARSWAQEEHNKLREQRRAQTQRQVQERLGKPVKGLRPDEWLQISLFASLGDQAACAQSIQAIGKDSTTHMFRHLQRVASRFPVARHLVADHDKVHLERVYGEDHRRWVALGMRGVPAAALPLESRALKEYLSYFSEQLGQLDVMQAKASELASRKAEAAAQLRVTARAQLAGPIHVKL